MDGVSRAVGAGVPVTIGEKSYILSPFRSVDYGTIEQAILKRRRQPIAETKVQVAGLPVEVQVRLLERAQDHEFEQKNFITDVEFEEFLGTQDGRELILWLVLRREQSEFTNLDDCKKLLLDDLSLQELQDLVELAQQASATDQLGKGTGPGEEETKDQEPSQKEVPSITPSGEKPSSTGEESSGLSPSSTDTPQPTSAS